MDLENREFKAVELDEGGSQNQLPSDIVEDLDLKDRDLLLLMAKPEGSNYRIRWWKHLTSGGEMTLTRDIKDIVNKYDSSSITFTIEGMIPGNLRYRSRSE